MLYEACCTSVSDYGSEIWGYEPKDSTRKIHLRAARAFLGVPRNTTSVGVLAEINWTEPIYRTQLRMVRQYLRVTKMHPSRLPRKIMEWDKSISEQYLNLQTWYKEVKSIFTAHNMSNKFDCVLSRADIDHLKQSMWVKQTADLKQRCSDMPKLRLYNAINDFGVTPTYLLLPMSFVQKMFLAKLRLSALPLRIETGRFERPRLMEGDRLCQSCNDGQSVENESHFVFDCESYNETRSRWKNKLNIREDFNNMLPAEKLRAIFKTKDNIKITAQYIISCFDARSMKLTS